MTKKSGLFDVDFNLSTPEMAASIKGEKVTTVGFKPFEEALSTIINQMQVSGYSHRTLKDYDSPIRF